MLTEALEAAFPFSLLLQKSAASAAAAGAGTRA
jgi:hypothetical protein